MNNDELIHEICTALLYARRNFLSIGVDQIKAAGLEVGQDLSTEEAEIILADLFPYIFGPKSIFPVLLKMDDRGKNTSMDVYNILTYCHVLDKTGVIKRAYALCYYKELPEPNIEMAMSKIME